MQFHFKQLLHSCVNSICGRKPLSYNDISKPTGLTEKQYTDMITGTKKLIIETVGCFSNDDEVSIYDKVNLHNYRVSICQFYLNLQILQHISGLDEEHKQCIADCIVFHRDNIKSALQLEVSQISGPAMIDFDWRLKVNSE